MNSSRRWLPVSFLLFMAAMLGLALAGGIRAFHPAPYWDMWDGAIDFLLRSGEGGAGLWWEQHNEHRGRQRSRRGRQDQLTLREHERLVLEEEGEKRFERRHRQ